MPANDMPADDMPAQPPMPSVETVSITVFTNIDALTPSPRIRVLPAGEPQESPAALSVEKGSSIRIEISREGYKTVEKEIAANGPSRVKISMERLRTSSMEPSMTSSMSMEPLFNPDTGMEPVMTPAMSMNIDWD